MRIVGRFVGEGWLRVDSFCSSKASYEILIHSPERGPAQGEVTTDGRLLTAMPTMIEASLAGYATLVLENGKSVRIKVVNVNFGGMTFTVREAITDLLAWGTDEPSI